jgi:hypothetical protein
MSEIGVSILGTRVVVVCTPHSQAYELRMQSPKACLAFLSITTCSSSITVHPSNLKLSAVQTSAPFLPRPQVAEFVVVIEYALKRSSEKQASFKLKRWNTNRKFST